MEDHHMAAHMHMASPAAANAPSSSIPSESLCMTEVQKSKLGPLHNNSWGGLRDMLKSWKQEAPPTMLERELKESPVQTSEAMASIHSKYLNEAAIEDKELKGRWSETLNVLLIFGGLMSATITAFILAVQPQIEVDPMFTTNALLLQILQRLDNGTTVAPQEGSTNQGAPVNPARILAWWYASLSCSLASTFGALLTKQWVMHYESRPFWASSIEMQSLLRECRYQGLARWKFYAVLEGLPILLQFSLLLFAIGLTDYLHPTPLLFTIVLSFMAAVGAFYVITLLAGTFFPSCPLKSPATLFLSRAAGIVFIRAQYVLTATTALIVYLWLCLSKGRTSEKTKGCLALVKAVVKLFKIRLGAGVEFWLGEYSRVESSPAGAGVLCSQLQRLDNTNDLPIRDLKVAAGSLMALPIQTGLEVFRNRDTFELWCDQVILGLSYRCHPQPSQLIKLELLCHTFHHFPDIIHAIRLSAARHAGLDVVDEESTTREILRILRKSWGTIREDERFNLPVPEMRPTLVAAYLAFQLSHWSYQAPEERMNGDLLLAELPFILKEDYLEDTRPSAVADAVTILSFTIMESKLPSATQLQRLLRVDPLERLFKALERLSRYPTDHPPQALISLALLASKKLIAGQDTHSQPSWRDGQLAETLFRLLKLGQSWRKSEPKEWVKVTPGVLLSTQVQILIASNLSSHLKEGLPGVPSVFLDRLDNVFATLAYPVSSAEQLDWVSEATLPLLRYTMEVRHPHRNFRLPRLFSNSLPTRPTSSLSSASIISMLKKYPQIVSQLARLVHAAADDRYASENHERRPQLLHILLSGYDIFFSPSTFPMPQCAQHEQVLARLATLSNPLPPSGGSMDAHVSLAFADQWAALDLALADLELALLAGAGQSIQVASDTIRRKGGEANGSALPSKQLSGSPPGSGLAGTSQPPQLRPTSLVSLNALQPEASVVSAKAFEQASKLETGTLPQIGDDQGP